MQARIQDFLGEGAQFFFFFLLPKIWKSRRPKSHSVGVGGGGGGSSKISKFEPPPNPPKR